MIGIKRAAKVQRRKPENLLLRILQRKEGLDVWKLHKIISLFFRDSLCEFGTAVMIKAITIITAQLYLQNTECVEKQINPLKPDGGLSERRRLRKEKSPVRAVQTEWTGGTNQ